MQMTHLYNTLSPPGSPSFAQFPFLSQLCPLCFPITPISAPPWRLCQPCVSLPCTFPVSKKSPTTPSDLCHASHLQTWAAWHNTWRLIKLTPKGVVFSFLFSHLQAADMLHKTAPFEPAAGMFTLERVTEVT